MGVCETVRVLAEAVAQAKAPQEPRHLLQIEILRLMPSYLAIGDLGAWESAFQGVLEEPDDQSEIGQLLWEVFEFGRHNMYCAFMPAGTSYEFVALAALLARSGVALPPTQDISGW